MRTTSSPERQEFERIQREHPDLPVEERAKMMADFCRKSHLGYFSLLRTPT